MQGAACLGRVLWGISSIGWLWGYRVTCMHPTFPHPAGHDSSCPGQHWGTLSRTPAAVRPLLTSQLPPALDPAHVGADLGQARRKLSPMVEGGVGLHLILPQTLRTPRNNRLLWVFSCQLVPGSPAQPLPQWVSEQGPPLGGVWEVGRGPDGQTCCPGHSEPEVRYGDLEDNPVGCAPGTRQHISCAQGGHTLPPPPLHQLCSLLPSGATHPGNFSSPLCFRS